MQDLIVRLLRRHPHFEEWIRLLGASTTHDLAFQFAVVDRWRARHPGDVDMLYKRLMEEINLWTAFHNLSMFVPRKSEFAKIVHLHMLMVCNVPGSFTSPPKAPLPTAAPHDGFRQAQTTRRAP
ncbi:hypothetical protein [Rhizobium leguminosarum]|uniref:hypothetical protein n=1 Tax=Rhizobium leguminosarum TaxID=384 RepID=UPI0010396C11|nr:hypothetical protein [Rhizobium leguminosarum]TCA89201.1 hypothetical protein E0H76_31435 [Rhizobium leguminosarum bv. viciae]